MPGIEGLPRLLRCCDRRDRSCDLPPGKVLLIMTVEIGNGQSDSIKVYPNDQPLQLAKDFCAKARSCVEPQRTVRMSRLAEHQVHRSVARFAQHGLDPMVIVPLADNISSNISKLGRACSDASPLAAAPLRRTSGVPTSRLPHRARQKQRVLRQSSPGRFRRHPRRRLRHAGGRRADSLIASAQ